MSAMDGAPIRHTEFFYIPSLEAIPDPIGTILEQYSHIPKEQQISHVQAVRDRAYKSRPYPCLGRFRFLALDLSNHPLYRSYVLPTLAERAPDAKPLFLDLGTCLGQDIRKLIYDGADPALIYGSDVLQDFIDAGYELFRDEDKFPRERFLCPADVFDSGPDNVLSQLDGKVSILHTTAVFHLFDQASQSVVAERCFRLLRKEPGTKALLLGAQVGNVQGRETIREDGKRRMRHDAGTWRQMWENVVAKDEWKGVVKRLEVRADLMGRELEERHKDFQQGDEKKKEFIGRIEEGFRWMVWWVWVEF